MCSFPRHLDVKGLLATMGKAPRAYCGDRLSVRVGLGVFVTICAMLTDKNKVVAYLTCTSTQRGSDTLSITQIWTILRICN